MSKRECNLVFTLLRANGGPRLTVRDQERLRWGTSIKANALHHVALYAGVEIMWLLADADLIGLDPTAKNQRGMTPSDLFYRHRNSHCTTQRKALSEEVNAWQTLVVSACHQNGVDLAAVQADGNAAAEQETDACQDNAAECGREGEDENFVDAAERLNE